MFLGAVLVFCMQGRRRCILDGVGISDQRILVSIIFHITAHGSWRSMLMLVLFVAWRTPGLFGTCSPMLLCMVWSDAVYAVPHLGLLAPHIVLRVHYPATCSARTERCALTYPPMITQCCIRASLPAGQLQLSALSVSGARPYGANAITGYQVTAGVYYGATCGGAQQRFQCLRSRQHCVFYSAFSLRRSSCARVCGWRDGSGAMFLGVVCSMQGRRRCILDGVGISFQRILVSILISHNSSGLMAIDSHVG